LRADAFWIAGVEFEESLGIGGLNDKEHLPLRSQSGEDSSGGKAPRDCVAIADFDPNRLDCIPGDRESNFASRSSRGKTRIAINGHRLDHAPAIDDDLEVCESLVAEYWVASKEIAFSSMIGEGRLRS
jgi:hypothetical protein